MTAPVASQADGELREGRYVIENGWLSEQVDEHTCGTGRDGHYGAHEPGCGLVPIARIEELLADAARVQRVRELARFWELAETPASIMEMEIRRALDPQ